MPAAPAPPLAGGCGGPLAGRQRLRGEGGAPPPLAARTRRGTRRGEARLRERHAERAERAARPSRCARGRQPMGGRGERRRHAEPACPRRPPARQSVSRPASQSVSRSAPPAAPRREERRYKYGAGDGSRAAGGGCGLTAKGGSGARWVPAGPAGFLSEGGGAGRGGPKGRGRR